VHVRRGRGAYGGAAVAGVALCLLGAGTAAAVPTISGADGDVWNATRPVPAYDLDTNGLRGRVIWQVERADGDEVAEGAGRAPLTVRLPGIADGAYRLVARDQGPGSGTRVARTFRVDRTPPRVTVRQPVSGAVVLLGAPLLADYACEDAVTCVGSVAPGAALNTSVAGAASFEVRAADDAGNETVTLVEYSVQAASTPASPQEPAPSGPAATPSAPIVLTTPPAPAAGPRPAPLRPRTVNARALRPAAGTTVATRRPLLRWTARRGARLYNVQVFRMRGTRVTKVLSAFPRANRLRVPAGRLAPGHRYIWRVWPYVGRGYVARPLGLSWFAVRRG